jgi:hypothetical protein
MTDLILETRLCSMKKTLERISNINNSAIGLTNELQELLDSLDIQRDGGIHKSILSVLKNVSMMNNLINPYLKEKSMIQKSDNGIDWKMMNNEDKKKIISNLNEAHETLTEIGDLLDNIDGKLKVRKSKSFQIGGTIIKSLDEDIAEKARHCARELGNIDDILKKAKEADQKNENEKAKEFRELAWKEYERVSGEQHDVLEELYVDYVDLLGGLALRDKGFDEGICQLAEELIEIIQRNNNSTYYDPASSSLAIPSRQSALCMRLSSVIHIGFPEWTIWALPFAAHEFWHVVISKQPNYDNSLLNFVKNNLLNTMQDLSEKPHLDNLVMIIDKSSEDIKKYNLVQELLADAFATFVMGPAYAFASILLRFDPSVVCERENCYASDPRRVYAVLRILKLESEGGYRGIGNYGRIISDLESEWNNASEKNKNFPPNCIDAELKCWIKAIWKYLDTNYRVIAYSTNSWQVIKDNWIGPMWHHKGSEINLKGDESVRDVLNAAWLCRITNCNNGIADMEDVDNIAIEANNLRKRIHDNLEEMKGKEITRHGTSPISTIARKHDSSFCSKKSVKYRGGS